jgi:tRNA/rRNA methyltransferase
MNLGQAVALCLWELARDRAAMTKAVTAPVAANAEELVRLEELLVEVLRESGYTPERTSRSAAEKTRRLIRRMELSHKDAVIWQGILRQILWKLTQ